MPRKSAVHEQVRQGRESARRKSGSSAGVEPGRSGHETRQDGLRIGGRTTLETEIKFAVETEHPLALESLDYLTPRGAVLDNSINLNFNKKLYELFPGKQISVLDLGCSGGGMVRSFIEQGHIAVGLEGSDAGKILQDREWPVIPYNLFNCDIAKPFVVHTGDKRPYKFDVVTMWEVLEHIREGELDEVFKNIKRHIKVGGYFIGGVSNYRYYHHVTIKTFEWWVDKIHFAGLS